MGGESAKMAGAPCGRLAHHSWVSTGLSTLPWGGRSGVVECVVGKVEVGLGLASLALGVVALVLAVFMGSILVVWAAELMDHAGILPGADHRSGLRYP
jgi:hypothetical protein